MGIKKGYADSIPCYKKDLERKLSNIVQDILDLSPRGIIDYFDLYRPIYKDISAYGHFGDLDKSKYMWERIDIADEIAERL